MVMRVTSFTQLKKTVEIKVKDQWRCGAFTLKVSQRDWRGRAESFEVYRTWNDEWCATFRRRKEAISYCQAHDEPQLRPDRKGPTITECKLNDNLGKTVAMGSRNQMLAFLKHNVPDGVYAIEGPGIDMTYYREEGIVYPCGGTQDGKMMPSRSLVECKEVFGT